MPCYSVGTVAEVVCMVSALMTEFCLFNEKEIFARTSVFIKKIAINVAVSFVMKCATSAPDINAFVCDDVNKPFPVVFCKRTRIMINVETRTCT